MLKIVPTRLVSRQRGTARQCSMKHAQQLKKNVKSHAFWIFEKKR